MVPADDVPATARIRVPIDLKLKVDWHYDSRQRVFRTAAGERFAPADLPRGARIVYKVPPLEHADPATLSEPERDLRRYLQIILPQGVAPAPHLPTVRTWPPVAEAHVPPMPTLPGQR